MKESLLEGLLILTVLSILIFVIFIPDSIRFDLTGWPGLVPAETGENGPVYTSQYGPNATGSKGSIYISSGNAGYSSDPMDEYIILENRGSAPVNITGWRLENNKSARSYPIGNQYVRYASDTGIIPQGALIVSPSQNSILQDIILKPYESAIVVSGGPGNISPYYIVSFKENLCTGYFGEKYVFPSGLRTSCVRPSDEFGAKNLDSECKKFVDRMNSCHTPEYGGVDVNREQCKGCVDGVPLSTSCTNYIKAHYSYPGCLVNHQGDSNFEGDDWHVYLYRPWEMWSNDDETIYLYDSSNNLVTSSSY